MIKSLQESKANLSELVDRASKGEDVLITVHGQVKARLTQALPLSNSRDHRTWADELLELHHELGTGKQTLSSDIILTDDRDTR
ncbi:MAG: type II toxin-antitoxin system prevent-host-death family antitoxin [Deinococcota bacterium]